MDFQGTETCIWPGNLQVPERHFYIRDIWSRNPGVITSEPKSKADKSNEGCCNLRFLHSAVGWLENEVPVELHVKDSVPAGCTRSERASHLTVHVSPNLSCCPAVQLSPTMLVGRVMAGHSVEGCGGGWS